MLSITSLQQLLCEIRNIIQIAIPNRKLSKYSRDGLGLGPGGLGEGEGGEGNGGKGDGGGGDGEGGEGEGGVGDGLGGLGLGGRGLVRYKADFTFSTMSWNFVEKCNKM